MKEEAGLVPSRIYSADLCEQFYEVGTDSIWVAPVFVAHVDSEATVRLNEEHSEYCWTNSGMPASSRCPFIVFHRSE